MKTKTLMDTFKEGAKKAGDYTREISKITGARVVELKDLTPLLTKRFNLNRNIHKQYEQLGEVAYELFKLKGNINGSPEVQEVMSDLKNLEGELHQIENKIEALKASYDRKVADLKKEFHGK